MSVILIHLIATVSAHLANLDDVKFLAPNPSMILTPCLQVQHQVAESVSLLVPRAKRSSLKRPPRTRRRGKQRKQRKPQREMPILLLLLRMQTTARLRPCGLQVQVAVQTEEEAKDMNGLSLEECITCRTTSIVLAADPRHIDETAAEEARTGASIVRSDLSTPTASLYILILRHQN
jgi:hypothetical protein